MKTPFERAEPAGRECVRVAREAHEARKKYANQGIADASKDIAKHISGLAKGRVSVVMNGKDWDRIFGGKK